MQSIRLTRKRAAYIKQYFYSFYATNSNPKIEEQTWDTSIAQAEKVVGYPTSFLNLRWLLSDEFANAALHLRKLVGTNHPLLDVAKDLIMNNEKPSWGLIILLLSKAGGHNKQFSPIDKDMTAETFQIQHTIAKVTQMLFMTIRIHKSVTNANSTYQNYGNKVAILCGDYFLAKCLNELASLRDQDLVEYMASAWRDLTITQYIGPRDKNNKPYPLKPKTTPEDISFLDSYSCEPIQISNSLNNSKTDWILRNTLGDSGLLGKACSSILKLAGYSQLYQNLGFSFGKYFGLAYQALKDMNNVRSKTDTIDLISLPVLLHLPHDPELYEYIEKYKENIDEMDHNLVRRKIIDGNALEEGYTLQKQYANAANCILNIFGESDAKILLQDILKNIELGNNI